MAVEVKSILLWRSVVEDRPGALAEVLEPITATGADLQVVMGYREAAQLGKAVIEIFPVKGKKLTEAAEGAGLTPSTIPALLVTGANRAGLAHRIAHALAAAGINLRFLVAQSIGRRYSAVLGLESEAEATRAAPLIRRAAR